MRDLHDTIALVRADGQQRDCRCPAHDDQRASLSVGRGDDDRMLLHCQAGCTFEAVLTAAGLHASDLFPERPAQTQKQIMATYRYEDEGGRHLFDVVRFVPKDFRQRRADGTWSLNGVRRVLYRLRELQGYSTVYVAEGEKDADRLWALSLPATCNSGGAGKWRPEYVEQLKAATVERVVMLPDNDDPGRAHALAVATACHAAGLTTKIVTLPDLPPKGDVSDWLDRGHTREELAACVKATPRYAPATSETTAPPIPAGGTLAELDAVFVLWLGAEYDLDALHAVLATAAAERLTGDPLWLLLVSGPGNAKTETVQALAGAGALVTSTVSSEGALLSATSRRERAKDSTGGLLRRIGDRGLLVVKDVTSILAMNRDTRAALLAAFREIHDGTWERNVGTDGGRSLKWTGRLVIVGAVTTAWDRAHDVIASMGDRFVLVRMDSTTGRMPAGRRACQNTGDEIQMRRELAAAVGGVLAGVRAERAIALTEREHERLLEAADVVTLARTGVDYDYRGDVIDAHAPEMPTRFAKQLTQLVRGAVAIGLDRDRAMRLALRCARDSMSPLRLAILDDVAGHPGTQTRDVRRRLEKPRTTVDRQLQSLHMLGVLSCEEEDGIHRGEPVTRWRYQIAATINPSALDPTVLDPISVPERPPHTHKHTRRETDTETPTDKQYLVTNNSGAEPAAGTSPASQQTWAASERRFREGFAR